MKTKYIKIETFIPMEYVKNTIEALNDSGLLIIGSYDYCYSECEVTGYYRPLEGSKPFKGKKGKISAEKEIKIEFRIKIDMLKKTIKIIKENHPYEEPVIDIIPLLNI